MRLVLVSTRGDEREPGDASGDAPYGKSGGRHISVARGRRGRRGGVVGGGRSGELEVARGVDVVTVFIVLATGERVERKRSWMLWVGGSGGRELGKHSQEGCPG